MSESFKTKLKDAISQADQIEIRGQICNKDQIQEEDNKIVLYGDNGDIWSFEADLVIEVNWLGRATVMWGEDELEIEFAILQTLDRSDMNPDVLIE